MSDETLIDHYKQEIEKLKRENISLRKDRTGKLKNADDRAAQLQAELDAAHKERDKLAKQLDELPRQMQDENDNLKSQIRTRTHRDEFERLAKEIKADPTATEALWKLSEYKPDADEVNHDAIREAITKTLDANPFLKGTGRPVEPGPAGGQGARSLEPGTFTVTYEQGRDIEFLTKNYDRMKQARKEGKLVTLPPKGNFGSSEN